VELENNNGTPFETENLIDVVENNFNLSMTELDKKIFEKLDDFKGNQEILDDTAVMSCKFFI
jgi:sigma-B regulation protein RsbU (phosphoserine phosphatase)